MHVPLPALALLVSSPSGQDMELPHTKFTLDNGLQVVVHEDHSDPVVAVYLSYHVGSAREEPGRSGFAHLFEHMLFQGSQHVADDGHFKKVSEAGGTLNGTTNLDRTLYYEVLPAHQLELALWLEADRMGFLLPAVTEEKFENQRDVVKNERRQNYENRPYGRARETLHAALYPPDHPYSWITIGSMADLSAATLADVHAFFRRWYGPNNATLAIGGDVDTEEVRAVVQRWFGSIPRGPEVARPEPRPVEPGPQRRVVIEDAVTLPRLELAWPTVAQYEADDAALTLLARILSTNEASILDKALTVDETLARSVSASHDAGELAGHFHVGVTAAPGVELDRLEQRVRELLAELAERGVDPGQLQRMKTRYEAGFVRGLETVGGRTRALAESNTFTGDPAFEVRWLERMLAVTPRDVEAVLARHLASEPAVVLSIVPTGQIERAASGRTAAQVAAEAELDRSTPPAARPSPEFASPAVWHDRLDNGIEVVGTPFAEIPMTRLVLSWPAGRAMETPATLGLSSLAAALMDQGTRDRTATELTEALDALGASLSIESGLHEASLALTVLDKHLEAAVALVAELLLEPRFAPEDFARIQKQRLTAIATRGESARGTAERAFDRLTFGADSIRGLPEAGTRETVEALTVDDVRAFWERTCTPAGARLSYVGARDARGVRELLGDLVQRWTAADEPVEAVAPFEPPPRLAARLFLVDKPGAAQSEVRIGHPSLASTDADYYLATVMNYVLGGSFSSRINMNLREDKGYTYGARSAFSGGLLPGTFRASAAVHTEVTAESVRELLAELEGIRASGVTEEELSFARSALLQAATRRYESMAALAGLLDEIGLYGWPDDFPAQRLAELEQATPERLSELAREHVRPEQALILVVGDAAAVREPLEALGLGPIVDLDVDGAPLSTQDG